MANPVLQHVSLVESLFRLNRRAEAAREVRKLLDGSLARAAVAPVARLARELGMPGAALKVLHPIVRESVDSAPSPEEVVEYAAALAGLGGVAEAIELVDSLPKPVPDDLLPVVASIRLEAHDAESALASIEAFLAAPGADAFRKALAQIDRSKALAALLRFSEARACLNDNAVQTAVATFPYATGEAQAWSAQLTALETIAAAASSTPSTSQTTTASSTRDKLLVQGELQGAWFVARLADLAWALAAQDTQLLVHLYFGTPSASFREFVVKKAPWLQIPDEYLWQPQPGQSGEALDLLLGAPTPAGGKLKIGQLLHRLLAALASDFYGPVRQAALHATLYPREPFHPTAGPARLHEAAKRLRSWFRANDLPLTIEERGGAYRLVTRTPCTVRIPRPDRLTEKNPFLIELLQEQLGDSPFTVHDASERLGISSRSALRLLADAQARGLVLRTGQSRAIRYKFPESSDA